MSRPSIEDNWDPAQTSHVRQPDKTHTAVTRVSEHFHRFITWLTYRGLGCGGAGLSWQIPVRAINTVRRLLKANYPLRSHWLAYGRSDSLIKCATRYVLFRNPYFCIFLLPRSINNRTNWCNSPNDAVKLGSTFFKHLASTSDELILHSATVKRRSPSRGQRISFSLALTGLIPMPQPKFAKASDDIIYTQKDDSFILGPLLCISRGFCLAVMCGGTWNARFHCCHLRAPKYAALE